MGSLKCAGVAGLILLALFFPPFSYAMAPYYQLLYRREAITRLEFDHDYFGAI